MGGTRRRREKEEKVAGGRGGKWKGEGRKEREGGATLLAFRP
jgi:hypothetical protein